jgi:hypothetical protein
VTWVKWKLISVYLETVLISTQDKCMVCFEFKSRTWKSFWAHPMELLGGIDQLEARFSLFGDSVRPDARYVCSLRRTCNTLRNHSRCTRWNSEVTWVKWKLISVHLQTVLTSTQGSTICVEYTTSMEILLAVPDGPPR